MGYLIFTQCFGITLVISYRKMYLSNLYNLMYVITAQHLTQCHCLGVSGVSVGLTWLGAVVLSLGHGAPRVSLGLRRQLLLLLLVVVIVGRVHRQASALHQQQQPFVFGLHHLAGHRRARLDDGRLSDGCCHLQINRQRRQLST